MGRKAKREKEKLRKLYSVERRPAYLSLADVNLILDALEYYGHATGPTHKMVRQVLYDFQDTALKLRELEATLKACAWWDDPNAWLEADRGRGLERYKKADRRKKIKCIAHESAEVVKQLIEDRRQRDARRTQKD